MLYGRRHFSTREIRERARQSLDIVGLSNRADHFPSQLSGGQQQRVAIARALINEPQILLADEPTGNLDSKTSVEIMGVFQKLNAQGITVVMVTHELDIAHYCKRNLIMRDGRLVSDTPVVDRLVATEQMQRIVTAETDAKLIA
jgi:putative ABC transport system ATP-binding protein